MKKLFYTTSILVIVVIVITMLLPRDRNPRDFFYLLSMLVIFVSFFSGLSYVIKKVDKN